MKFLIFSLIAILMTGGISMVLPNVYAAELTFTSECVGGIWKGIITSSDGEPLPNTTVRTITKITASSFEKKFITDQDGVVQIPFEDNTGNIWIQKGGFNDQKYGIEKCKLESKSTNDAQEVSKPKLDNDSEINLPPPRILDLEDKEYVEPMNVLGKTIRVFDEKICIDEFCKTGDTLPVYLEGNIGLNTKKSIKLQIVYCSIHYFGFCESHPLLENLEVGRILAKNNGGGDFHADWIIRKTSAEGAYQINGIDDDRIVGEVGNSMMDMVNGIKNGRVVVINNVEKLNSSNTTFLKDGDATITVLEMTYGQVGGIIKYEVCAKHDLKNPSFEILSDIDRKNIVREIELKKGECYTGSYTIQAKAPSTILVPLATEKTASMEEIDSLKTELAELREMLEEKNTPKVPNWIKNNVQWWADGQVDDQTFVNGIEFMVKEKLINIPNLPEQSSDVAEEKIPDWIRNNAVWWSEGAISEDDFINGIEFLVQKGIIKVN